MGGISEFTRRRGWCVLGGVKRSKPSKVEKVFALRVRRSGIPGAGKGLFTRTAVEKGDVLLEYEGEKLTYAQIRARYPDLSLMSYVFYVGRNHWVDAARRPGCLARYANDARGKTKVVGLRNNAEYQVLRGVPYIVATRRIAAGGEIFVSYGEDYWENHVSSAEGAGGKAGSDSKRKQTRGKKSKPGVGRKKELSGKVTSGSARTRVGN